MADHHYLSMVDETSEMIQSQSSVESMSSEQLHDLKIKYDALKERTKVLQLENTELQKEIRDVTKDNNELQTTNQEITRQHTETRDDTGHMALLLSTKSNELTTTHEMNEDLQNQISVIRQEIKTLSKQNSDLNTENNLYKQRLEESLKEKEKYTRKIDELNQNVYELQFRLNTFAASSTESPSDDFKYTEDAVAAKYTGSVTPPVGAVGGMNRQKTMKWKIAESPSESIDDDEFTARLNSAYNSNVKLISTASNKSMIGGFSRVTTLKGLPETMPMMVDTGTPGTPGTPAMYTPGFMPGYTPGLYANVQGSNESVDLTYDTTRMQIKEEYESMLNDLLMKHKKEVEGLDEKLKKIQNDYKELRSDYKKKMNTINDLRTENVVLNKKAAKQPCYVFEW